MFHSRFGNNSNRYLCAILCNKELSIAPTGTQGVLGCLASRGLCRGLEQKAEEDNKLGHPDAEGPELTEAWKVEIIYMSCKVIKCD